MSPTPDDELVHLPVRPEDMYQEWHYYVDDDNEKE
jgi:hypothetical protein